jgi:tape measure domain-containing protein
MAEDLRLTIAVDDKGTPVVSSFAKSVRSAAETMQKEGNAAAGVFAQGTDKVTSASGKARDSLGRFVKTTTDAGEAMRTHGSGATQQFTQHTDRLTGSLGGLGKVLPAISTAVAALGLVKLASDAIETATKMESLQRAFTAAAGSSEAGAREFAFVRAESQRLGLELTGTAEAYKGLVASTVASGKSAADAQLIFKGMATASAAMGLSADESKGALLAVQQMMAKGKVSAEELVGQLGERFPPAVGLMAKALGVSTGELYKMMEQGKVTADALIPFAQQLITEYGEKVPNALTSPQAAFNLLKNAATDFAVSLGKGGLLDAARDVANALREMLTEAQASGLTTELGAMAKEFGRFAVVVIKDWGPPLIEVMKTIAVGVMGIVNTFRGFTTMAGDVMRLVGLTGGAARDSAPAVQELAAAQQAVTTTAQASAPALSAAADSYRQVGSAAQTAVASVDGLRAVWDTQHTMILRYEDDINRVSLSVEEFEERQRASFQRQQKDAAALAEQYKLLGLKAPKDMQAAAEGALEALKRVSEEGKTRGEDLARAFLKAATTVQAVYGKDIPEQYKALWEQMEQNAALYGLKIKEHITETMKTAVKEQEAAMKRTADAMRTLGIQGQDALTQAATNAMTAWAAAFNLGTTKASELLQGAVEVKDRMMAAYGKLPAELEPIFRDTAQKAIAEFRQIQASGEYTPAEIRKKFEELRDHLKALGLWEQMKYQFAGIEQAGVDSANKIGKAHEENAQRATDAWAAHEQAARALMDKVFEQQKAKVKELEEAYKATTDQIYERASRINDPNLRLFGSKKFASDEAGIRTQLQEYKNLLYQMPGSYGAWDQSGDIYANNRRAIEEAVAELERRLAGLSETRQAGRYVTARRGGWVPGETAQSGRMRTRQGERATLGSGEMVLDRSTSDGLRDLVKNGGGRGGGLTINNPQFVLNQTGVDPRAMDGRAVLWAMLPALRELFRQADYDPRKI